MPPPPPLFLSTFKSPAVSQAPTAVTNRQLPAVTSSRSQLPPATVTSLQPPAETQASRAVTAPDSYTNGSGFEFKVRKVPRDRRRESNRGLRTLPTTPRSKVPNRDGTPRAGRMPSASARAP